MRLLNVVGAKSSKHCVGPVGLRRCDCMGALCHRPMTSFCVSSRVVKFTQVFCASQLLLMPHYYGGGGDNYSSSIRTYVIF